MFRPGDERSGGGGVFEMVLGDSLEKPATAPATVADKCGLIQNIISDVNQSEILCLFQRVQEFLYRCSPCKPLLHDKIRGIPKGHADIINGGRAVFAQMPCLMPAIAIG